MDCASCRNDAALSGTALPMLANVSLTIFFRSIQLLRIAGEGVENRALLRARRTGQIGEKIRALRYRVEFVRQIQQRIEQPAPRFTAQILRFDQIAERLFARRHRQIQIGKAAVERSLRLFCSALQLLTGIVKLA